MDVPVVLVFVHDHREHLSHAVIDALELPLPFGMIGARRNFSHA